MIRLERIKTWSLLAVLTIYTDIPIDGKVAEILDRGTILFGTTGDYIPLSFSEPSLRKLHEKYGLVYAYE
jgi:hypothetical protein